MFSRGQAALEYLMTYGWALIVVALAVGILVFIAQPPGSTFRCNSSDPNILVKGHDFPQYSSGSGGSRWGETCGDWQIWEGTIVLQNATGKNIEIVDAITEGYFFTFLTFGIGFLRPAIGYSFTASMGESKYHRWSRCVKILRERKYVVRRLP